MYFSFTDVPPPESTVFPGVCPEDPERSFQGQHYFWIPFRGYCYIFLTEIKEWTDAAISCVAHGKCSAKNTFRK